MSSGSGDILGADFLTNPKMTEAVDIKMPELDAVELPSFGEPAPAPKLMPTLDSVGPIQTSDGFHNLNAEPFMPPPRRQSEEHVLKEKYEMLRKFERLQKLGVPLRKRFTLDSPLDEMKMELEFVKREKDMDATIKQFCDWYVTGMSALEWSSLNVPLMKAFGLNLNGLSESAQMGVGDMEDDFEELYELYGDKMKIHPLVRIPIRTCMMIYMVHLTNQMAQKSPVPNMDQILRSNPDIARQLATAAMQQQSQSRSAPQQAVPVMPPPTTSSNPLSGLANFMSGMIPPPPPQQTNVRPQAVPASIKGPVRLPKPQAPPPAPMKAMAPPPSIDELLKSVGVPEQPKRVSIAEPVKKKGGSTGKNSVTIKL